MKFTQQITTKKNNGFQSVITLHNKTLSILLKMNQ